MKIKKLINPLDKIPDADLERYAFIGAVFNYATKEDSINHTIKYFSISKEQATKDVEFVMQNFTFYGGEPLLPYNHNLKKAG